MPYTSERRQLLRDLKMWLILASGDDDEEEEEEAAELYALVSDSRFISGRIHQPRPEYFFKNQFLVLSDDEFRALFRTTRLGFQAVVEQIQHHPVFHNNSTCKQAHAAWQLAVAFARLGSNGNGASVKRIQTIFGIGAGTTTLYTGRVITALKDFSREWLVWPDARRRREIRQVMSKEGFPGCVGFIDGTTIPLSQKPAIDGEVYFDRKKRLSQ
ncbi:hypothetical protein BGX20_004581 [Mortierella sp. AD010]|nr:hypothetical protein BGX20_004581 [Mortierella sp. AD010]